MCSTIMLNYYTYLNEDSAKWVCFVHGAGGSSSIWFRQVRFFKKEFNVLVIDLRGHGKSKPSINDTFNDEYTFNAITEDILEVLDYLKIKKAHFIGISLGTILIRNLAEQKPELVESMVLAGAILKLNIRSQILMRIGNIFKSVVPYMMLYKLFAFIIMPKKNHKQSRILFVNEAKKLYQKEFIRWFKLTAEINPLLKFFRVKDIKIPTLYIMGEQDYLFLPSIKRVVNRHIKSTLYIINNCGHIVNVEQPDRFNSKTIGFLNSLSPRNF
ncbi:MAG: 3-oxoadipate enol-lactonase 2 [Flavobacterium sp. SCGC AAA160-P02]|nr:MAG: 3-oxoadipate enol-lactonase 2 [Flavobacterium sp. SCGC AAA160-P02]